MSGKDGNDVEYELEEAFDLISNDYSKDGKQFPPTLRVSNDKSQRSVMHQMQQEVTSVIGRSSSSSSSSNHNHPNQQYALQSSLSGEFNKEFVKWPNTGENEQIEDNNSKKRNFSQTFIKKADSMGTERSSSSHHSVESSNSFLDVFEKNLIDANSDNDDDDDDEKTTNSKSKKSGSGRANVREHSKAQREKRKETISSLEAEARKLVSDLNDMNSKFIASLQICRDNRLRRYEFIVKFLKLWINDSSSSSANDSHSSDTSSGKNLSLAAQQSKILDLFDSIIESNSAAESHNGTSSYRRLDQKKATNLLKPIEMTLPSTYSRFSPPLTSDYYSSLPLLDEKQDGTTIMDPVDTNNLSFDPYSHSVGTKASRRLSNLSHVIADSLSLATMCQSITEFGPIQMCRFSLGVEVPMEFFIYEDSFAMAPFTIYSKNATICGGKFDVSINGYLTCEFTSQGAIKKIDLSYDDWYLTEQLLESFGPSIYRSYSDVSFGDEDVYGALQAHTGVSVPGVGTTGSDSRTNSAGRVMNLAQILHLNGEDNNPVFPFLYNKHATNNVSTKNSSREESRIFTSLDSQVIVEAINSTAFDKFGPITGRSLISADWVDEALSIVRQWCPYACTISTAPSNDAQPTIETKCFLFPLYDKSSSKNICSSNSNTRGLTARPGGGAYHHDPREEADDSSCVPNKICWIITDHRGNSKEKQLEIIIQQFLRSCVTKYASKLNYTGASCYFLSFMSLLSQAELIIQRDDEDDEDGFEGGGVSGGMKKDLSELLNIINDFLKWMVAIETRIWSEDMSLLEAHFLQSTEGTTPPLSDHTHSTRRLSEVSLMQLEKMSSENENSHSTMSSSVSQVISKTLKKIHTL